MAANDSPTSIANLALVMLGEEPIANLTPPDNTKRAILAAQFYDPSRRAMLAAGQWKCAKRQAQLAASAVTPPFRYAYAYPLPADYIRPFDLYDIGFPEPYEEMNLANIGRCLVTDHGAPIDLEYIFDLVDTTAMDPLLVMAIAADLAAVLATPLARDLSLKQTAESEREGRLAIARTSDAQKNSPREWDTDILLRSRF